MKKPIVAVTFDLWETLLCERNGDSNAEAKLAGAALPRPSTSLECLSLLNK